MCIWDKCPLLASIHSRADGHTWMLYSSVWTCTLDNHCSQWMEHLEMYHFPDPFWFLWLPYILGISSYLLHNLTNKEKSLVFITLLTGFQWTRTSLISTVKVLVWWCCILLGDIFNGYLTQLNLHTTAQQIHGQFWNKADNKDVAGQSNLGKSCDHKVSVWQFPLLSGTQHKAASKQLSSPE